MVKINGPTNVVRMEGSINGINKVIYLFMDWHMDVKCQTDCNNPKKSVNIAEYLKRSFTSLDGSKKKYDFFLEITPEFIANKPAELFFLSKPKLKYLESVWKFYYKNVKYDPVKNKLTSQLNNVRLHYIDIRSVVWYFVLPVLSLAIEAIETNNKDVHRIVAAAIVAIMLLMNQMLETLKNRERPTKMSTRAIRKFDIPPMTILQNGNLRKEYFDHLIYLMNKFLHGYIHKDVKKTLYHYIDTYLIPKWEILVQDFVDLYGEVKNLDYSSYQNEQIRNRFIDELGMIKKYIFHVFTIVVDLYFLRRFMDKDYVTNSVIYAGASHCATYIYILNSIGFKITHCANCNQNITELNDAVASVKNFPSGNSRTELLSIFLRSVDNPHQCSDMSKFPNGFR